MIIFLQVIHCLTVRCKFWSILEYNGVLRGDQSSPGWRGLCTIWLWHGCSPRVTPRRSGWTYFVSFAKGWESIGNITSAMWLEIIIDINSFLDI